MYQGFKNIYLYFFCFITTTVLMLIINIIEPLLGGQLTSNVLNNKIYNNSIKISIIWISIFIFRYLIEMFSGYIKIKFKNKVYMNLHQLIYSHILSLDMDEINNYGNGYLVSRQNDDIESIEGLLLYSILDGLTSILLLFIIFVLMIRMNLLLGCISIILVIFSYLVNFVFPLKKLYKEQNESKAKYNNEIYDSILGIKQIKLSNKIEFEKVRQVKFLKLYFEKRYNRDIIDILRRSLTSFIDNLHYPIIIIVGVLLINNKVMNISDVITFILFFQKINGSIVPATNFIPLLQVAYASAERILDLLSLKTDVNNRGLDTLNQMKVQKEIKFKNINFSYKNKIILKNLNLSVYPNKINAIVGTSGSGKSTIVDLLLRFLKADDGCILIDGNNINQYTGKCLRNSISVVTQDNFLFNRSILENLLYSNNNVDINTYNKEELDNIMKYTDIYDKIKNLENGLYEVVGQLGSSLSGGEKQKICISRELLKNSNMIIFDEATSALDSISEEFIKNLIIGLSSEKTIITIAHRLSSVIYADVINVLNDGKIVETGTHQELMELKGFYYNLYCNQTQLN